MAISIEVVEVSTSIEQKINGKHGVTADEVLEACGSVLKAGWELDHAGKNRLLVLGRTQSGRRLAVVLYPIDGAEAEWRLATAYRYP